MINMDSVTNSIPNLLRMHQEHVASDHFSYKHSACSKLKNSVCNSSIRNLSLDNIVDVEGRSPFTRRTTALTWHPSRLLLASCSKFGDINIIGTGDSNGGDKEFFIKAVIDGGGPGCSVSAIKFDVQNPAVIYYSSLNGTVRKCDIHCLGPFKLYAHSEDVYSRWFCSMDVNFQKGLIVYGDNKGVAGCSSLEGSVVWHNLKLHKGKIHHCEFNFKDPNIFVTSSLETPHSVKFWDIRNVNPTKPLNVLLTRKGVNVARFNPSSGTKLLVSDQENEIKIFQGPLWTESLTIKHHHKQFQHITPVTANWHPLCDVITIGNFPKDKLERKVIQFFDSEDGEQIHEIPTPNNLISSLNAYSSCGDYLAFSENLKTFILSSARKHDSSIDQNRCVPASKGKRSDRKIEIARSGMPTRSLRSRKRTRELTPIDGSDDENNPDDAFKRISKPANKKKIGDKNKKR